MNPEEAMGDILIMFLELHVQLIKAAGVILVMFLDAYAQLIIDTCNKDTFIAEVVLTILLIVAVLRKGKAAPDKEKAKYEQNAKIILKVGILVAAFTALAPAVVSYFR